jgi:Ca2+-binding RTX toxin-like protein
MIQGTSGNDKISVVPSEVFITKMNGDAVQAGYQADITVLTGNTVNFNAASVKRIVVDAAAGNDDVLISPSIKLNATLMGGAGKDTLVGGAGSDVLSGGAGNDMLFASSTTIIDADAKSTLYGLTASAFEPAISIFNNTSAPSDSSTSSVQQSSKVSDSLDAGIGNDTLYASNGPDTLHGGDGSDTLVIIGRGPTNPPQIIFRRGNDARTFDGLTFSSIESIEVM